MLNRVLTEIVGVAAVLVPFMLASPGLADSSCSAQGGSCTFGTYAGCSASCTGACGCNCSAGSCFLGFPSSPTCGCNSAAVARPLP